MKLRTSLLVRGALVPAAFLVSAIVLGGVLFERRLMQSLDDSLRALAEVESVSVFDQGIGPHLHSAEPPLFRGDRAIVTSRAVYAENGERVIALDAALTSPTRLPLPNLGSAPVLRTRQTPGGSIRELIIVVVAPNRLRYAFWIATPTSTVRSSVETYAAATGLVGLLAVLVLFVQQLRLAERLSRRVRNLTEHMAQVEEGRLDRRPASDDAADEIGMLRDSIAQATAKLETARLTQERLIADAAHELRTPLAALRTNIDVTLRRDRDGPELRQSMEELRDEVDRLSALAASLLELARGRHDKWLMSSCDLRALLEQSILRCTVALEQKGVDAVVNAPASMACVCDVDATCQAFENVINNAVKFSPARSKIRINAGDDGDAWSIEFENDGPSIPDAEREAIFAPFHRLEKNHGGTGLGLTIVREIIERHGGTVEAMPQTTGARFVIRLPQDASLALARRTS